jgi:metal-dependent amidase/aminoacylase/carboxypeptidase family protein
MDAEDFSFVEENVPSPFFQLGKGSRKAPETLYALHHPRFFVERFVLPNGAELHVSLSLRVPSCIN